MFLLLDFGLAEKRKCFSDAVVCFFYRFRFNLYKVDILAISGLTGTAYAGQFHHEMQDVMQGMGPYKFLSRLCISTNPVQPVRFLSMEPVRPIL